MINKQMQIICTFWLAPNRETVTIVVVVKYESMKYIMSVKKKKKKKSEVWHCAKLNVTNFNKDQGKFICSAYTTTTNAAKSVIDS